MRTVSLGFVAMLTLLILAGRAPGTETFTGDIMDSRCGAAGSHAEMMKSHEHIITAKECTLYCVKNGSKFILYNGLSKMLYQLDGQNQLPQFAGQRVVVTGNLDNAKQAIHVTDIKVDPVKPPFPASDQPHR
jgi:hypothetical protein